MPPSPAHAKLEKSDFPPKVIAFDPNLAAAAAPTDFFEVVFRKVDVRATCARILEERNEQRKLTGGGRI